MRSIRHAIDSFEAPRLAERAHLVVELDAAADCNRGQGSWAPTNDPLRSAAGVEERFLKLENYAGSPAYVNRTQFYTNVSE
jgi:hypothetical protein